ncbi:uncharacterized protein LOC142785164 [Rhipicephalus microplus]|uniref:uncharacterized protein LOC142785164 n=1 Tax=Rhipicephalus microplus TaxID=6941 RepID=UPI003F6B0F76
MQDSRRSPARSPTFVPSPRSAHRQPSQETNAGLLRSPVSFGGQGVRSPVFGQDGIGSPYYDRERSEAPKYEFVAESKSDPRYAMISFESSEKSTSTNTYSATYRLSDADPLPESTEKFRLMGSADSSGSKSSGLASSALPSGSSSATATAGTEQAYGPLPRRKVAMGIFCLVAASATAITLLVQGSLPLGDEGHVGTGTDPPLQLEKGSDTSPDSAGFALHFARRRRLTTETRKTTRKQPPFLIVSLRPRTTTPSTLGPFTWPPFPETYPPWDFVTDKSKNTTAEVDTLLDAPNFDAADVLREHPPLMDEAPVTAFNDKRQDEQR